MSTVCPDRWSRDEAAQGEGRGEETMQEQYGLLGAVKRRTHRDEMGKGVVARCRAGCGIVGNRWIRFAPSRCGCGVRRGSEQRMSVAYNRQYEPPHSWMSDRTSDCGEKAVEAGYRDDGS